ncbi:MAG: hypothetical protein ABIH34_05405 [Nanoarchaeota archaeon]
MNILLDTNVLLMPWQLGVDVVTEITKEAPGKLFVLDRSVDELHKIVAEQKGKDRRAALFALELLKKGDIGLLKTESLKKSVTSPSVDTLLVAYDKKGYLIVTQDRGVQKQLTKYLVLRQKKYFKLIGA